MGRNYSSIIEQLRRAPFVFCLVAPCMVWISCSSEVWASKLSAAGADPQARAQVIAQLEKPRSCEDLVRLVAEELEGLVTRQSTGLGVITLRYKPAELIACMSNRALNMSEACTPNALERRNSEEYMLDIDPRTAGPGSMDTLRPKLEAFLSEDLQQRIVAISAKDSIPCAFVHVEQGVGGDHVQRIILGFDRDQNGLDRKVVLKDTDSLLGGDVTFDFVPGAFEAYEYLVSQKDPAP